MKVHKGKMSSIRVSLNFIRMMILYKGIIVKLHEMNRIVKIIKELLSADAGDYFQCRIIYFQLRVDMKE